MSFSDDAVKAKLSALNETQESIVTVAQWVMFHRRHSERIVQIWLQKIRDSPPPKRLNLIYLANEIAQQSKARSKPEFLHAFSPVVAEATAAAYTGTSNEIQQKLRRVVEVWRQRSVFEAPILDAVEGRVNEIDKTRSTGKQSLGGTLFKGPSAGSTPSELQPLIPLQVALNKAAIGSKTSATTANSEYEKLHDPQAAQPTPPVHAARLSSLLKTLANAESSVSEVIKSRRALIDGLEKLLATNRSELEKDESLAAQLAERRVQSDTKKRDVEDAIMRGLSTDDASGANAGNGDGPELTRPEPEALTPPPVEALTPVGSPKQEPSALSHGPFAEGPQATIPEGLSLQGIGQADYGTGYPDQSSISPGGGNDFDLSAKRRKTNHEEDYSQFAAGELDADIAELIAQGQKQ
ncbi:hypothetical protein N7492_008037 [Penicillium capsulatum]|uniref:CID domain-containing protein n=1 Tax=Penicillium capsulatum TaxID=69766 RepID=A0A9W9LGC5_9EURO|nr:hypothetical protein N7492_008037 [Penicillium capsulatum]KAJ6105445.1 hypothetical protein N7512_008962 [Penicillium capsulatum]